MAIKLTKLTKRQFFDKLKDYAGFTGSICLMHSQHKIAVIEVTKTNNSQSITPRYDITVRYVGNTLKKIESNSFSFNQKIGVETISSVYGWNSLTGHQETIFDFRSIEIAEQIPEPVKEEVKPAQQAAVVIKTTVKPEDERLVYFRFVAKGTPFWYMGSLYQRTNNDSHNAMRIKDGCLCNLHFDVRVLKTTIEVSITGECP